ncbi:MAG TPA: hypothetical protein VF250_02215 [Conexibacter sp.]
MNLGARRAPGTLLCVLLAFAIAMLVAGVAHASTEVTGTSGAGVPLTIDPDSEPIVSDDVDLAAGTRVFFVESMPKSMTVRRVTLGDFARASGCSVDPDVELSIYAFASGSDLSSGSLLASSSAPRPFAASLERVTWLLDPTPLAAGGTYALVLRSESEGCAEARERSWAHNGPQVDGGERACAVLQDGSGRFRLWHQTSRADAEACGALSGLAGFEAGMPTGWAEALLEGERATINTGRGTCAPGASEAAWGEGIVCQFGAFTAPGETTEDGWYYGLPWIGPGLDGSPRDIFLELEPDVAPAATTDAATDVHSGSARLHGTVDPGGSPTRYRFEWGTTTGYGNVFPEPDGDAGGGTSEAPVAELLRGLEPSTTYHYRLLAAHGEGTPVAGADRSFTTTSGPQNTTAPAISGDAFEQEALVASPGSWRGSRPIALRYQWRSCDASGENCEDVEDATTRRHPLGADDIGTTLRVRVTATDETGEDWALSDPSPIVTAIPPLNDVPPIAYGQASEGATLTALPGAWFGAEPLSYAYQWRRCDARGASCGDVEGATAPDYRVAEGDVGATLRVAVTASNDADSATAVSAPSAVVTSARVRNTSAPTIDLQTTADGDTLVGEPGSWSARGALSYEYRWQRCGEDGADCTPIPTATGPSYVLAADDVGATLRLLVTAGGDDGTATASSAPTDPIANAAPANVDSPTVSGAVVVDGYLSAERGTWSGAQPMTFSYQWQQCDERGANCEDVDGATDATYAPVAEDAGATLRVVVRAENGAGDDAAPSAATPVVLTEPRLDNTASPTISGTLLSGETLSVSRGLWSGTGTIAYAYRWQRCGADRLGCEDVEGATGSTYALGAGDVGHTLAVTVTATDDNESADATTISAQVRVEGAPALERAPALTGTATVGQTLSVSDGSWTGSGPVAYAYAWQTCEEPGECSTIDGATRSSYRLTEDDAEQSIRAVVTATNGAGSTAELSNASAEVSPPMPYVTEEPTIGGEAREGDELTADHGAWSGVGTIGYAYQWRACDAEGESCSDVEGATSASYRPVAEDVGGTLRVVVTATDEADAQSATSEPSAPVVAAGAPRSTVAPAISGTPRAGETLSADEGTWSGEGPLEYAYQWQRCDDEDECDDVEDATDATYRLTAADVYSFVRVVVTATNGDGSVGARSALTASVDGTPLPQQLVDDAPPTISGDLVAGQQLTADPGDWSAPGPIEYAYQWQRCEADGECTDIEEATGDRYTLWSEDVGSTIRVSVTATSGLTSSAVVSDATDAIAMAAPVNATPPTVAGEALDTLVLAAEAGEWDGAPDSYDYRWQRCDAEGANCRDIDGAGEASYLLTSADIGATVRAVVTATNAGGSTDAASEASSVVAARAPSSSANPAVSGLPVQGLELSASTGDWEGTTPFSYAYQWQRCDAEGEACTDLEGATSASYRAVAGDVGRTLRVVVRADNAAGRDTATSDASDAIGPPDPPVNTVAPSVSGNPSDGQTLDADTGSWSGLELTATAIQWQLCDARGASCADVERAIGTHFTVPAEHVGSTVRVKVEATNPSGTATAYSSATAPIATGAPEGGTPDIDRDRWLGAEATATPGDWNGSKPMEFSYRWQRCDAVRSECVAIEGATDVDYAYTEADVGSRIGVEVTARNRYGEDNRTRIGTVVADGPPEATVAPSISGTTTSGSTLTAEHGTWNIEVDSYDYEWRRCDTAGRDCVAVPGVTASSYVLGVADLGRRIVVAVTAHIGAFLSDPATSTATAAVAPPATGAPSSLVAPSVTGIPEYFTYLGVDTGYWQGATPLTFRYQWQACTSAAPESCSDIPFATFAFSWMEFEDVGRWRRVLVRASNRSGSSEWVASAVVGPVTMSAPRNVRAPVVSGAPVVGSNLSVENGSWQNHVWEYSVQWQRCDADGRACVDRPADGGFFPSRADLGSTLRAVVTASNSVGSTRATSAATAVIGAATPPSNTEAPAIVGSANVDERLYAEPGAWDGSPQLGYDYEWRRCDEAGESCADIVGASEDSYVVGNADVGSTIVLVVTATNGGGSVSLATDPTGAVAEAGAIFNTSSPSIPWWWTPQFGEYIVGSAGEWTGRPDLAEQWQRCDPLTLDPETEAMTCVDIPGASDLDAYEPVAADVGFKLRIEETATTPTERVVVHSDPSEEPVLQHSSDEGGRVDGLAVVGQRLRGESTVVSDAGLPVETTYTFRLETGPEEWETVLQEGEEATYTIGEEALGHRVRVEMRASILRDDEAAVVDTRTVNLDTAEVEEAPTNEAQPTVEGGSLAGEWLTAAPGEWSGGGGELTFGYQWLRCNAEGEACATVRGATEAEYRTGAADVGHTLRVRVTAANGPVSGEATSEASEVVTAAAALTNTGAPAIFGEAAERETLAAGEGEWEGDGPITYAYQWQTCELSGDDCEDVAGATGETFRIPGGTAGQTVRVRVTATNGAGSLSAASTPTGAVAAGPAPVNLVRPRLRLLGPAEDGSTLVVQTGQWANADAADVFARWQRCDTSGQHCRAIAVGSAYDIRAADVGSRIRVLVTAETEAGSAGAATELTSTIGLSTGGAAGKIAFTTDGGEELWISDKDGGGRELLVRCSSPGHQCSYGHPRISPNGKLIAAVEYTYPNPIGSSRIAIIGLNHSKRTLPTDYEVWDPVWTPRGTSLLARVGYSTGLAVLAADGSNAEEPQQIPTVGEEIRWPALSPDGSRLVYVVGPEGWELHDLMVARSDGRDARLINLPNWMASVYHPTISPDNHEIIFAASEWPHLDADDDTRALYSVQADGSNLHRITSPHIGERYDRYRQEDSYDYGQRQPNGHITAVRREGIHEYIITIARSPYYIEPIDHGDETPKLWSMGPNGENGHRISDVTSDDLGVSLLIDPIQFPEIDIPGPEDIVGWLEEHIPGWSELKPRERAFCSEDRTRAELCLDFSGDRQTAETLAKRLFSGRPGTLEGTKANAFQHAYWTALMTHSAWVNEGSRHDEGLIFSRVHEFNDDGNPTWEERVDGIKRVNSLMDLHNNHIGYELVNEAQGGREEEHICARVLELVRKGYWREHGDVDREPRIGKRQLYWIRRRTLFFGPGGRAEAGGLVHIDRSHFPEEDCHKFGWSG